MGLRESLAVVRLQAALSSLVRRAGDEIVLLFDEAEALFGKRSEVKDSHDRYSTLEPQKIEALDEEPTPSKDSTADGPDETPSR